jgi:4-amino-4-deoxy-L-arabinose transferase-like glycosyltransferase
MTTIAPPRAGGRTGPAALDAPGLDGTVARIRAREDAWVLPATAAVLGLAAVLYIVNLTVSGYANVFYSGAAWAAAQSWSAWFMGSIDPANFITVDKPPLATMMMGLSVRLFGLSSASILLPEALMGVAKVALLMATVRRTFGGAASIIAGLVTALTPAAVLMFRYNNPDALLTLLFVGGAYAVVRALGSDRIRWLALAGVLVGLAFETKLLQGYLALPAFAITYAITGRGSIRRRVAGLLVAAASVTVASAWWIVPMTLLPLASRAFVGGSADGTALNLVLAYDGLGRIFGQGGGGGGGASFSGTPGILRLFNSEMGGQVAWLLPLSIVGLGAGLIDRARAARTDLPRAGFLLWGLWLAVHAVVFSFMSGTIHSYYTVVMAPAIGALVGGGVVAMWRARERHPWVGVALGLAFAGSAGVAMLLLDRTPSFAPGLGIAVLAVSAAMVPVIALRATGRGGRVQVAGAGLALAMLLAAPAAYAVDTMQTAYAGGVVAAGPTATGSDSGFGGANGGPGANGSFGGQAPVRGQAPAGGQAPVGGPGGNAGAPFGANGGAGGGPGGSSLDTATLDYLVANQGSATWLVAASDSTAAGQVELSTGRAVMSMGGFTGSDNALTLDQLKAYVASGQLRFVEIGGQGGGGQGGGAGTGVSSWVASTCTAVIVNGATSSSLYDCAAAAATGG